MDTKTTGSDCMQSALNEAQAESLLKNKAFAFDEWVEKTNWVQEQMSTFPIKAIGMHRADVMREEIERLRAARQQGAGVDCIGLALDLEQQAKRVESQTVERAMLAAAHGLRLLAAAISLDSAVDKGEAK